MTLGELEFGTREFTFIHRLRAEDFTATLDVFEAKVGRALADCIRLNRGAFNRRDCIKRDFRPGCAWLGRPAQSA